MDIDELIEDARLQNRNVIGKNGDTLLLVSNLRLSRQAYDVATKNNTGLFITLNNYPVSDQLCKYKKNIYQKIIFILKEGSPFIFSNNFLIMKLLDNHFYHMKKIDVSMLKMTMEESSRIENLFNDRKLVISMGVYGSNIVEKVNLLVQLLKSLDPHYYFPHREEECAVCHNTLSSSEIYVNDRSVPSLYKLFSLPICGIHQIDIYRVATELGKNKFDYSYFVENIESYQEIEETKCKSCKNTHYESSSPYCMSCLISPLEYYANIALGFNVSPRLRVENKTSQFSCWDCHTPLDRPGLCPSCEKLYDWTRIHMALESGTLSWVDFSTSAIVRARYRLEQRQ